MEDFIIKGSHGKFFIPEINFIASSGKLTISGESYVEDTVKFYTPVVDWLENYMSTVKKPIDLEISLTYFNTSSSRSLLDIFLLLKKYQDEGGDVKISWICASGDSDIREEIEDFELDTGLKIEIVTL